MSGVRRVDGRHGGRDGQHMTRLLDEEEIARQIGDLPGWSGDRTHVRRTYKATDFPAAILLVDEVARDAEELDHHPDIDIRWRSVTFVLSTHSAGGVTQLDIELAHRIADHAERLAAT